MNLCVVNVFYPLNDDINLYVYIFIYSSMTNGESFRDVIFPLGRTLKPQVKEIATKYFKGLNVLTKKESMGICFIGPRSFPEFLSSYITLTPGHFVDWDTRKIVGRHHGKEMYTIGQKAKIGGE